MIAGNALTPLAILLAGGLLVGCAGVSRQEAAARLGAQYVGQNVDVLVGRFGPPANSFRLNAGGTSYEWQLTAVTDSNFSGGDGYASGSSRTRFCKVRVIADPAGIIANLDTEDGAGASSGGLVGAITGVRVINRSLCAEYLGMKSQT